MQSKQAKTFTINLVINYFLDVFSHCLNEKNVLLKMDYIYAI